jgi:hypothetical protein
MPYDTQEVLRDKLKNNSFSIQVYESTDFNNKSYVVVFVKFINDGEIQENVFCRKKLRETSTGRYIFSVFYSYLKTKDLS